LFFIVFFPFLCTFLLSRPWIPPVISSVCSGLVSASPRGFFAFLLSLYGRDIYKTVKEQDFLRYFFDFSLIFLFWAQKRALPGPRVSIFFWRLPASRELPREVVFRAAAVAKVARIR